MSDSRRQRLTLAAMCVATFMIQVEPTMTGYNNSR